MEDPKPVAAPKAPEPQYAEPPEEDNKVAIAKTYVFNPLQAKKEIETGDFYMRRGNYGGAAMRYLEATLWDDGSADAFYKLGEASEKAKNYQQAREAFTKFLTLNSDKKKADEVKKRVEKYPGATPVTKNGPRSLDDLLKEDRGVEGDLRSKGIYRQQ